jgi:hypothetical protein
VKLPSDVAAAVSLNAGRFGIDPLLVSAIVMKESGGNAWAWKPEPAFRYLWDVKTGSPFRVLTMQERVTEEAPADFPCLAGDRDQEWWAQQASWGAMQVMGAVAREYGFRGDYLTELLSPGVGVEFGCRYLQRQLRRYANDLEPAISAYNAGSSTLSNHADYVEPVLAFVEAFRRAG